MITKINDSLAEYGTPGQGDLLIYCPGCEMVHAYNTSGVVSGRIVHEWDGRKDEPTIRPELVICVDSGQGFRTPDARAKRCVSKLIQGYLEFDPCCHHAYAGQALRLPKLPHWINLVGC